MIRPGQLAVDAVSRVPARVQTKLLVAFLAMVALLILLGAVGLRVLSGMHDRTEELIELQRKIAAFRQVQHDTTRQLYGVASALLSEEERALDAVLRQLSQFGYDLDRLQYVAQDEVELLAEVREDYDRLIAIVAEAVEHARAGRGAEARDLQTNMARPLADRLERRTNQLVNVAEADMLERIEASQEAYDGSRTVVVGLALASIVLALALGYVFSWSIVGPLGQIATRLRQIAGGDFDQRVEVKNRDELGALAADVNRTSEELGRLYGQLEERTREVTKALEQQTATSAILRVISTLPTDVQPVFETIVRNAVALCGSLFANVFRFDGELLHFVASHNVGPDYVALLRTKYPMRPDSSQVSGRALLTRTVVRLEDAGRDPDYDQRFPAAMGWRRMLGVPMLRQGEPLGVIVVGWAEAGPVAKAQEELLKQFADQAVIAIENVRLFDEVQARTRELSRSVAELRALGEVSQAVNSNLELKAVLTAIAAHAVALAEADAGAFLAFDAQEQVFRLQATHQLDPGAVAALTRRPARLGEGAVGRAGLRRAAVQIPDIDDEPGYSLHDIIRKPGYRALLAVPLLREGSLTGGLVLCRRRPGAYSAETVNLVQTLANQSVLAIENAKLFEEIERKGRELAEASRHKSEFLANMSHELRTPLNAVLGYSELIQDGIYGDVPDKIREVMERIQQNGRHLLGLINDVLDLAKIEAGELKLAPSDYSMRELVLDVVSATEALANEKRIELRMDVGPDLPPGRGDERRITQVLLNLVSNAIKFTDAGSVTIRARVEGDQFRVAVADTGMGIAPEDQERIFGEFQQVDSSSTRKKGGTGLGLAIARRIVELHGGRIWVESVPGEGATFSFSLPCSAETRAAAE